MFIPGVLRVAVCCLRGVAGWAAALGLAGRRGAPEGQPTALFVQSTSAVSVAGVWSDATTTTTTKNPSGLETMWFLQSVNVYTSAVPSDRINSARLT